MMQGRRHWRPPNGKARAMACGGNPRALPDFILSVTQGPTIWVPGLLGLDRDMHRGFRGRRTKIQTQNNTIE